MCALSSPKASPEIVRFLVGHGADANFVVGESRETPLKLAVQSGDLAIVQLILDAGADIAYSRPGGYDVLIDAMHRRSTATPFIAANDALIPILQLLIRQGAPTRGLSSYRESALSVASNHGRFDAVRLLLEGWSRLRAIGVDRSDARDCVRELNGR